MCKMVIVFCLMTKVEKTNFYKGWYSTMKKTIALMLAMLFAVCAFATSAFAETTTAESTEATQATQAATETTAKGDDVTDGFDTTTTTTEKADTTTTTVAASGTSTTTQKAEGTTATTAADVTATLKPGETAYEGQGSENKTTTKKPAAVDTTIPSTGSGIVVPAIALAVLAAGTVAVIKTKKED